MPLASTVNPHAEHFTRSPSLEAAAEAGLFAWAHRHRTDELVAYAFEDIEAPAEDDGLDRYDAADLAALRMAVEADPNELHHDRYLGTAFA